MVGAERAVAQVLQPAGGRVPGHAAGRQGGRVPLLKLISTRTLHHQERVVNPAQGALQGIFGRNRNQHGRSPLRYIKKDQRPDTGLETRRKP